MTAAPTTPTTSSTAANAATARRDHPRPRRRRGAQGRRALRYGLLFISPWIIGFAVFTLIPMVMSAYYSFTNYDGVSAGDWIGLNNYRRVFSGADPLIATAIRNTLYLTVFGVALSSLLSLGLALLLNQRIRGIGIYRTLFYLPTMFPIVVTAFIFFIVLDPNTGVVNQLLGLVGIEGPGWLYSTAWSKPALVILGLWTIGNSLIIYLAGLQEIPRHLVEAATIDGAGWWQRLRHVTLPMLSPVIFFNVLLSIIYAFQNFITIFYLTSGRQGRSLGGPADSTVTWGLLIYKDAFIDSQLGYAAALSWLMFVVVIAITIAMFGLSRRWVHYEGG